MNLYAHVSCIIFVLKIWLYYGFPFGKCSNNFKAHLLKMDFNSKSKLLVKYTKLSTRFELAQAFVKDY